MYMKIINAEWRKYKCYSFSWMIYQLSKPELAHWSYQILYLFRTFFFFLFYQKTLWNYGWNPLPWTHSFLQLQTAIVVETLYTLILFFFPFLSTIINHFSFWLFFFLLLLSIFFLKKHSHFLSHWQRNHFISFN